MQLTQAHNFCKLHCICPSCIDILIQRCGLVGLVCRSRNLYVFLLVTQLVAVCDLFCLVPLPCCQLGRCCLHVFWRAVHDAKSPPLCNSAGASLGYRLRRRCIHKLPKINIYVVTFNLEEARPIWERHGPSTCPEHWA